jgi:hypothetical protein
MVWQTAQQRGCLPGQCKIGRFIAEVHRTRENVCLCVCERDRETETEKGKDRGCDKSGISDGKMCILFNVQCTIYDIRVGRLCLRT